jgi:putative FmdB family regulatory protein
VDRTAGLSERERIVSPGESRVPVQFRFFADRSAMPIYAYRCSSCGHAKDVLQKVSDPVLTTCPACGAEAFAKQVTAAGFQLKGSGWYVTDFRGGGTAEKKSATEGADAKPAVDGGADQAARPPGDAVAPGPKATADKPAEKGSEKPTAKASTDKPATSPATPPAAGG